MSFSVPICVAFFLPLLLSLSQQLRDGEWPRGSRTHPIVPGSFSSLIISFSPPWVHFPCTNLYQNVTPHKNGTSTAAFREQCSFNTCMIKGDMCTKCVTMSSGHDMPLALVQLIGSIARLSFTTSWPVKEHLKLASSIRQCHQTILCYLDTCHILLDLSWISLH
jgi:hypothetical protein